MADAEMNPSQSNVKENNSEYSQWKGQDKVDNSELAA
jgi:hypothetical protein